MRRINKLSGLILFASLLLTACRDNTGNDSTTISAAEKETAKKAIAARIDEIISGVKHLDVEAAIQPYSSDSSFKIISPDGSVADYTSMKNAQAEFMKTLNNMNFTTVKEDFLFLSKDHVICTWTGNCEFEMKSGESMRIDPYVGTMLFQKNNTEWKIIYAHESAAEPVTVVKEN